MSYEAIVVGGGIVGASVAYHLARDGSDALLVDRADEGRATHAGAGILSPPTSSRTDADPWYRFAVDAFAYYPDLAARLDAEQDGDVGFARTGQLTVAFDDEAVTAFDRARRRIERRSATDAGLDADAVTELSPGEASERFPPLAEPRRAFYYADAARVDGSSFATSLCRAAVGHGLDFERGSVERVVVEDGAVAGVVADGARFDAESVVIAGGAWSDAFADQLGVAVPVEPQRGQIAHLGTGEATNEWPIVTGFHDHYLVPWPDGRVAAGATRESGVGFDPRATAAGVHEVLDEALRVAPGLGDAELRKVRVGLRPASADGLPVLGPVPGVDGAYLATGHGPTGLLLGPYSGRIVAEQVAGREPDADVSPFRVERFG
jgi:D-amino-acid dehydrogenase